MSTTAQQSRDPTSVARDLTDLYDIVIVRNPEACATCHARIRDHDEHDPDETHDGLGTGNKPTDTLVRVGAGELGHDIEVHDPYGAQREYVTRTYCGECGRPAGATPDDPQSRRTMLGRIPALLERLADHGLDVDVETLRTVVRHCKSQEAYRNRDDDIWRTAVALAVRDAYQ